MKIIKKQLGFALLEVLIAALIMIVGSVAFMRLQQMGLQYSYNNYARTEGLALAENFIEQLRGNVDIIRDNKGLAGVISGAKGGTKETNLTKNVAVFRQQIAMVQKQMERKPEKELIPNSKLCYVTNVDGFVRVTYLWKDNSKESRDFEVECPAAAEIFNKKINQTNSVTIYAQL